MASDIGILSMASAAFSLDMDGNAFDMSFELNISVGSVTGAMSYLACVPVAAAQPPLGIPLPSCPFASSQGARAVVHSFAGPLNARL